MEIIRAREEKREQALEAKRQVAAAKKKATEEARKAAKALGAQKRKIEQLCGKALTRIVTIKTKLERSVAEKEINRKVPSHIVNEAESALKTLKRIESIATDNACGDKEMQTRERELLESVDAEVKQADAAWKGLTDMQKSARNP